MNTVTSVKTYTLVFAALMILLVVTFALAHLDLGPFSVTVSLLIAVAKALLVALFFMHLKHASRIHWVMSLAGVFWLAILLTLTLSDYLTRTWLTMP